MTTTYHSVETLSARVESARDADPRSAELAAAIYDLCLNVVFEPDRVHPLALEMRSICTENGDALGRARATRLIGTANYISVRYAEVLEYMLESIPVFLKYDDRQEYAWANVMLASVSQDASAFDQGLEQCFRAADAIEGQGFEELDGWVLYRIADIYRGLGDKTKMLEFSQSCFDHFHDLHGRTGLRQHLIGLARARTQVAESLRDLGRYEHALELNEDGLKIYRESGDGLGTARCLSDIGKIHRLLGDAEKAEEYSKRSLALRRDMGHRPSQATDLLALGELYLGSGDLDAAETALLEALKIATEAKIQLRAYEAREGLSRVFEARGDTEQALIHYKEYNAIKEKLAIEAMNLRVRNTKVLAEIHQAEKNAALERTRKVDLAGKNDELAKLSADLRATQDSLVQSEKMASLGQLTAGIAHEIKNPLNFVNNFAELSVELMDELLVDLEERSADLPDDFKEDMDAIIDDLRMNALKIKEHGTRADSIVRSMLEHSRTVPGGTRDVDLNAFLEEFVNLAWHGAKASDADFQIEVDRDYDPMIGTVNLLPQDMGRTFINLLNNAFHAVKERAGWGEEGYRPLVTVTTGQTDKTVQIRFIDNGPGITSDIADKVFQPFFTTKPSGTGTGLGLSMSYDIITKGHGGTIDLLSREGEGATFVITLPRS